MPSRPVSHSLSKVAPLRDEAALLEENSRYILKIARQAYPGRATILERCDFEQAAKLGFIEANRRYDPARGTKLTTFAWPYVTRAVLNCLDDGRAEFTSFDDPNVASSLGSHLESKEDEIETAIATIDRLAAMQRLSDREALILISIGYDGFSQTELAQMRGCSPTMISRIYRRALRKMRNALQGAA